MSNMCLNEFLDLFISVITQIACWPLETIFLNTVLQHAVTPEVFYSIYFINVVLVNLLKSNNCMHFCTLSSSSLKARRDIIQSIRGN